MRLAKLGPAGVLRIALPAPGVLALLPLPSIWFAKASFFLRWRSERFGR